MLRRRFLSHCNSTIATGRRRSHTRYNKSEGSEWQVFRGHHSDALYQCTDLVQSWRVTKDGLIMEYAANLWFRQECP